MASLNVLTFDHEGRPIQFDTWLDDLQLYLLSESRDSVSLFDHTSGASLDPPPTADTANRSHWLTRDAATRLAARNHLPLAERAHFGQQKTAKALYEVVVARYSSPATAALGRLLLPYLFPELSAFATVEDLVTHLCTSDAPYRSMSRNQFRDEAECPRWAELLRSGVDIFALDYDGILAAMYALSVSAEGVCYLCVPPDPSIEAAALGASESALPGTAPAKALHTFTLDSGASRCFFRDSTTLTPLPAPVPVRLADPSGSPVLARSSTVLPCPSVPSGSMSGLQLPLFSTNLVSTTALQDAMVTTTTPGGQRVSICTWTWMGRHLATFTRRPGSSLCTLTTEPPQVAASAHVSAPGTVYASPPALACPALPSLRLETAARRSSLLLVSSTTASLQTLHMDVWGQAHVSGHGRERYFLVVVDEYTLYTTLFPLRNKGEVVNFLIHWIREARLQLRERFRQDLPVLRLHSDRGGEFSSDLLRDFCRGEGILQS
ncbi:unnamed protein product, partial [Closterium sp. NIES-54]